MKNIFGADITDKNDSHVNYEKFIDRRISDETKKIAEDYDKKVSDIMARATIPDLLITIYRSSTYVMIAAVLLYLSSHIKYKLVIFGALFLIAGVAKIVIRKYAEKRKKSVMTEEAKDELDSEYKKVQVLISNELRIPDETEKVDVLMERYIEKNGKVKSKGYIITDCKNLPVKIFEEDMYFCITDNVEVERIPFSSIKGISYTKWKKSFLEWNKEEKYNSKTFKKYKVVQNGMEIYFVKCLKVEFTCDGEDYYLMFPIYEKDKVLKIAHLTTLNNAYAM